MDDGSYADLMTEIPGLNKDLFDEYYESALIEKIEDVQIRYISYHYLLQNKKATAPKT